MTDITQRLPVELLTKILENVSVLDVLRFKQVNRIFCDVILASPLIQHKIDLFATGLEYNVAAGAGLSESRRAFHQYCSSLGSLRPVEEKAVDDLRIPENYNDSKAAGGVYAIMKESIQLFTLGSASRGIPHKMWEIPLPCIEVEVYHFYPGADVIAFVEVREVLDMQIAIHLKTLSNGACHPAAQCPTICYSHSSANVYGSSSVSIASSRLVILTSVEYGMHMVVWDWKTAQVLFTLDNERYDSVDFIDDYRLLVTLGLSEDELPCIALIDTENNAGGAPVQTLFHLSPNFRDFGHPPLLLDRGAHRPSPAEYLAPFHQDPAQRIVAFSMQYPLGYLVLPVESLLKLVEGRGGCEIGWDEWKEHVVIPSNHQQYFVDAWISGCRLFSVTSEEDGATQMEVYDLSVQGRAKHLSERVNTDLGGVRYMAPTGANVQLPWDLTEMFDMNGGQDSVVFIHTLNRTPDDFMDDGCTLHIWAF